jgi:hypothetical protein
MQPHRQIRADYTPDNITVYQAYSPAIAGAALLHSDSSHHSRTYPASAQPNLRTTARRSSVSSSQSEYNRREVLTALRFTAEEAALVSPSHETGEVLQLIQECSSDLFGHDAIDAIGPVAQQRLDSLSLRELEIAFVRCNPAEQRFLLPVYSGLSSVLSSVLGTPLNLALPLSVSHCSSSMAESVVCLVVMDGSLLVTQRSLWNGHTWKAMRGPLEWVLPGGGVEAVQEIPIDRALAVEPQHRSRLVVSYDSEKLPGLKR